MVYPATRLPVKVYLAPDGVPTADPGSWAWVDVTALNEVRLLSGISISQGRANWGDAVDSGTCSLTFDNRGGHYTPRNPAGRWYGSLGKNTPIKVVVRRVEALHAVDTTNGLGTATSGQTWTTSGGAASAYSTSGSRIRVQITVTNSTRWMLLDTGLRDGEIVTNVNTGVLATGGWIAGGPAARMDTSGVANGYVAQVRCNTDQTVTLIIGKFTSGALTTPASVTVPSLTHTAGMNIGIRLVVDGDTLSARAWDAAGSEPTGWHATYTDPTPITTAGRFGTMSMLQSTNTNTNPTVSYGTLTVEVVRFGGWVPYWPPRWDKSGNNATVPITAYGVLYRTQPGQAKPPSRSALYRTIDATDPAGYWPCEDGENATQLASAIAGDAPILPSGTLVIAPPEDYDLETSDQPRLGTSALVDLSDGVTLTAQVTTTAFTGATAWTAYCVFRIQSMVGASGNMTVLRVETPGGTHARWELVYTTGARAQVIAYTPGGVATTVIDVASIITSFGEQAFTVAQNGANIDVAYYEGADTPSATASVAGTLATPARVLANATGATVVNAMPFGHLALWAASTPQAALDFVTDEYGHLVRDATYAYFDEAAHLRLERLADEDDVDIYIPPVSDDNLITRMGWQTPGTPLELWRECEATDGGVLYERPFSLGYQPRAARYNQSADLALDFDQGQVADAPEPTDDDQQYRNRVKATRKFGSSSIVQTDTFADELTYDAEVELSLASDDRTTDEAAWRLWLYTQDVLRWPRLDLNLAASPELIDAWLSCRIGSRVTATNPPDQVIADAVDGLIEGYTETLGGASHKSWDVDLNLSPARPWQVAEVDGTPRVAAGASTLSAGVTSTATSLSIASSDGTLWTTDAADFPLDISLKPPGAPGKGERVTLSAISGTSSPQTATVSARSVNGVVKAHSAGAVVQVWDVAIVAH